MVRAMVCSITRLLEAGARASRAFIYKNNDNLSVIAISASKRKSESLLSRRFCSQREQRKWRESCATPLTHQTFKEKIDVCGKWLSFRFAEFIGPISAMPWQTNEWFISMVTRDSRSSLCGEKFHIHHLPTCSAIMDEIFIVCLLHPAPVSFVLCTLTRTTRPSWLVRRDLWEENGERFSLDSNFTSNITVRAEWDIRQRTHFEWAH